MTAFNVVRVRVKSGREGVFIEFHRSIAPDLAGLRHGVVIKTGERSCCAIGEWGSMDALVAARPARTSYLDRFRDMLEDLGSGLGVTDPVSGEVILDTAELMPIPPMGTGADKPRAGRSL
ncbi:DUF718 domain-containing protein [Microvirga vignae]|uniref:DUF718 domain-containing protein n=1 Tax=Microvirga vignae TaxID=1225564 RepID=UPI000A7B42B6|nr:DUF718 domain-containing protein [Microvirga vignae]